MAVAFAFLPLLLQKFKLKSGAAILVTGLLINLFALVEPSSVFRAASAVFTTYTSVHTLICIILIGVLGNMLKHYGFLNQIVIILRRLVHNKKLLIGSVPCIFGMLSVPGGAFLSAPFVDELGNDLGIEPPKRAAINLTFRHATVFLYPFASNVIYLTALIANFFSIYSIIKLGVAFSAVIVFAAYVLYFPRGAKVFANNEKSEGTSFKDVKMLAFYTMPIYFVVIVNFIPGVFPAMALTLSILLTYFLCDRKNLKQALLKGISINLIVMVAGVFFIQNTIMNLDQLTGIFFSFLSGSSDIVMLFAIAAGCLMVGLVSGIAIVPVGIFIPIIFTLPMGHTEMLLYVFFAWLWSFMGYYFSPLHLCQILTIQCTKVKTAEIYKEHIKLFPWLAAASFVLFFGYRFLLL